MNNNLKIFFVSLSLSLPFWWGVNVFQKNLENIIFFQFFEPLPRTLTAQISRPIIDGSLKPLRNWEVEDLKIEAKSVISVLVSGTNRDRIIFRKSSDKKLPIASISKLITSLVVLENYDPSLPITVSEVFPAQNDDPGHLIAGEVYAAKSILYPLLIESSNEAAYSVAEVIGAANFVELMNLEAKKIGMNNTYFINSSGIDPVNPENGINYSTAEDLVTLVKYISKKPEIMEIISLKEYDLISADGIIHHKLSTTNELLEKSDRVFGGKTGQTPTARGCLLLLLRTPGQNPGTEDKEYLINIILGSEDRFGEMEKLIDWEGKAYQW